MTGRGDQSHGCHLLETIPRRVSSVGGVNMHLANVRRGEGRRRPFRTLPPLLYCTRNLKVLRHVHWMMDRNVFEKVAVHNGNLCQVEGRKEKRSVAN